MNTPPVVATERVDDVPLLFGHMQRLDVARILDAHFETHGNHQGLSLGSIVMIWLAHILSRSDHRLNRVAPWAASLQTTLNAFLAEPLRETDLTDDRLADVLRYLSDDEAWAACEAELNGHVLRVYDLETDTVRVDSTTASGYWKVTEDGIFQFGHSKDHRPDLPQVKVMLAVLDPLGMPLAVDVLPGQRNDEPLYLPIIARVRESLGRTGLLYVGDCKIGAIGNRAALEHAGDDYLCPLGLVQLPAAEVDALVTHALAQTSLVAISRPDADGEPILDEHGNLVIHAEAWETSVELTATVDGETVTWTERRIVVRSTAMQRTQTHALERRLGAAEAALADLLESRQGKSRPTTPEHATDAIAAILKQHKVEGLLDVRLDAEAHTRTIRAYGSRAAREETTYTLAIHVSRNEVAITEAIKRMGWRVYVTNRPVAQLSITQVVLAYRDQYRAEQPMSRLIGSSLSLRPVYLSRDDHVTGLIRLLTIGLRVLSLLEYGIRRSLAREPDAKPLKGLYAGQPNRATRRPTAELVLEAFRNLTLTVVELPNEVIRHLTPLSALQQRLLTLAGLDHTCYSSLVAHLSEPLVEMGER
ncbi:MAG: DUF4277 domain-containing protein [Candidatus Viridilinea halotolerans]|uniref:DUF4277 domain-containing protein n=1 Tax=Candidatus Viridilinea halotolerans TaxID=2491704 RepID=A0A426UBW0_9CHLR|nr:MAG: DUF4277 domain-containing protein [Candidatus Viridilinea halotolerans]